MAVFFNKEVEANKLFSTISTDYQKLNASARAAAAAAAKPVRAAWISKFGDSITMSYAVYKQQLVTVSGSACGCAGTQDGREEGLELACMVQRPCGALQSSPLRGASIK